MSAQPSLDKATDKATNEITETDALETKILVCQNKTCKQQGSPQVLSAFKRCVPDEIVVEPSGCLGQCGNGPMAVILTGPTKTWYSHLQPADAFSIAAQNFSSKKSLSAKQSQPKDKPQRSIGIWIVGFILLLSLCALMAVALGGPSHYGY